MEGAGGVEGAERGSGSRGDKAAGTIALEKAPLK